RGGARERVGGGLPHHLGVASERPDDLPGEAVPGGLPGGGAVVRPGRGPGVDEPQDEVGEVGRPRGLADLVGDDAELVALGGGAGRGNASVVVSRTISGSRPSVRTISRVKPCQEVSPEEVPWYVPAGAPASTSRRTRSARSAVHVGWPTWSATTLSSSRSAAR